MFLLLRYSLYLHFVMADAILRQGKETNNDDDIASVRSESSTNMASKKVRTPRTSKKDIDSLELKVNARFDQQEKQFSAMDEKLSSLIWLFERLPQENRQHRSVTAETVSESNRHPLISLGNSLNRDNGNSDPVLEDNVSIHVSREERGHLQLSDSNSEVGSFTSHQVDNPGDERFSKYLTSGKVTNEKPNLGEKFGEDAFVKSKKKTGIVLEQNQIDVLNEAWRADDPTRVSAFKENYKHAFPIDESCESFFNVPKMDDSVEALLIKRFGHKAGFSRVPSLVSKGMKAVERLSFQGQMAARMGLITSCYTQQALGVLLDTLQQNEPNLDLAIQTVRDIFALSTKTLDQISRTGAFHHLVRRRATMHDTGLSDYKNYASAIMKLPLTSEGVFGSQFDKDLRDKKELNKQLSEVLPEISVNKRYQSNTGTYKRKSSYTAPEPSAKKTRTDFSETYSKSRPWSSQYKIPRNNYYKGDNFFRGDNKSKNVVSSFQRNFQTKRV